MIARNKRPEGYKEEISLVIDEEQALVLGKILASMEIMSRIQPKISSDSILIESLYQQFDDKFHEARWCTDKKCLKRKDKIAQ